MGSFFKNVAHNVQLKDGKGEEREASLTNALEGI